MNSDQVEDPQSKQQTVGHPAASSILQHGPLGAQHHPTACSGELGPCWELSPGKSPPVPWDRQELGPWKKQGAQSPLNFDYRNKTWKRMLEEGLQLPGPGEKGYSPSVPPNPASLVQVHGQKQLSGHEVSSSALTQLWREGSAPASLLNYTLLGAEGELSGSGCCFLQLPKGVYTHPTTFMGSI